MELKEIGFSQYYRNYLTIEADELTDRCKDIVKVTEKDCYALCSCYVGNDDGLCYFNILAIGPTWECCTKGLRRKECLGTFAIDEVYECEARIVDPSEDMIKKNGTFFATIPEEDDDLLHIRLDARLDSLRDAFYPDIVLTGVLVDQMITEYEMQITGEDGPFLKGILAEEPEDISIHMDDPMWALPYVAGSEMRLFALFAGQHLSEEEIAIKKALIDEMNKIGLSFSGLTLKN